MRLALLVLLSTLSPLSAQTSAGKAFPTIPAPAAGFDPAALASFDADIAGGKYGNVDSLLILRHGKIAFDKTYPHDYAAIYGEQAKVPSASNPHDPGGPYNYFNSWWHPYYRAGGELHTMQSVTKSVTSAVIGVAVSRHQFPSLDTPVLKFFDESTVANVDDRKRHMTIRNLITMTVGMKWQDDLPYTDPNNAASMMEASDDWVKFFIDQPMAEEPGTRFYYNDGAPETLAYIFRKATGQDIEEYAARNLFAPIGIEHWFWKRTPSGLADTEGGLYLERHDLAKLMMLFQHDGRWNGKQVLDAAWVKESLAPSVTVNAGTGVMYGYLWWLYPYGKDDPRMTFAGSGYGGQLPIVIPDYDIVIVVTAWNIANGKGLPHRVAVDRVLAALKDPKR
jgi:CubicO group peptidase (beta-lactamase class C family)